MEMKLDVLESVDRNCIGKMNRIELVEKLI